MSATSVVVRNYAPRYGCGRRMSKSLGGEGVSINKSELATNLNGQFIFNEFVYMSFRAA